MSLYKHITENLEPILDRKNKFMYFSNHKAAQTSIKRLLKRRAIIRKGREELYLEKLERYDLDFIMNQLFKFTIVRNPWSKVVSAFFYLRKLGLIKEPNFGIFVETKLSKYASSNGKRRLMYPTNIIEAHFDIQYHKAYYRGAKFVDFIGKIENINDDWKYIAGMIGIRTELHKKNKSKHSPYQYHYDATTKRIVGEIYSKDIEIFNYQY